MIKAKCPVAGYENFTIEYPAELKRKHQRVYAQAVSDFLEREQAAGRTLNEIPLEDARFCGAQALCSVFKNPPDADVDEWPLAVYRWFMDTVYWDHYEKAVNPPKN
jgi:hypothetical protein